MKKYLGFGLVAALLLIFAACSDDKDDKGIAGKIAGTYIGTITVSQEDGTSLGDPMPDQTIYINRVSDHTVNLELKDFKFGSIPVGNLQVPDVQVSDAGKINGSASQVPIMEGMIKADLTVSGTVLNDKADLLILVNAPLDPTSEPIVMHVVFEGSK